MLQHTPPPGLCGWQQFAGVLGNPDSGLKSGFGPLGCRTDAELSSKAVWYCHCQPKDAAGSWHPVRQAFDLLSNPRFRAAAA